MASNISVLICLKMPWFFRQHSCTWAGISNFFWYGSRDSFFSLHFSSG